MKTATITYSDGTIITTSINGTHKEIKNYFRIGRVFNVGSGENDKMAKVIKCEVNKFNSYFK